MQGKFVTRLRFDDNEAIDLVGKAWTNHGVTFNDPGRFGGKAAYFNGNSYLQSPIDTDLNIGTNDFTIAYWMKLDDTNQKYSILLGGIDRSGRTALYVRAYNAWTLMLDNVSININSNPVELTNKFITNRWTYIELSRKNNQLYYFIDGKLMYSESNAKKLNLSVSGTCIGWEGFIPASGEDTHFKGYIDDFVIINGAGVHTEDYEIPRQYLFDACKIYIGKTGAAWGMDNGSFSKLSDNWDLVSPAEKKALLLKVNYETAGVADLQTLGKFKIVAYTETGDMPNININAVPNYQLVVSKEMISIDNFEEIEKATLTRTISGNGTCKLIVTNDHTTYQTYDFTQMSWKVVDHTDLAAVKSTGINAEKLADIDRAAWDKLIKGKSGIGFAYLMGIDAIADQCAIDQLTLQANMKGTWK